MTTFRPDPDKALRDICDDLRARVKMMEEVIGGEERKFQQEQERAALEFKRRMETFRNALEGYRNMLVLEEAFAQSSLIGDEEKVGPRPEIKIQMPEQKVALPEFFIARLRENGPMTKEELRIAAQGAGYFGDFSGGRSTHVTLENIKRSNRVFLTEDGKFRVSESEKALL